MGRRNAGSPVRMAQKAANRMAGSRAQRRADEAIARKASVPALKKLIRRNKQRQG
jgi:hypothetical protein